MAAKLVLIRTAPDPERVAELPRPEALRRLTAADRALLELLILRGRTYSDIGSLLRVDAGAVRARAHAAADRIASGRVRPLGADARGRIVDLVLGQQSPAESTRTRRLIDRSPSASEWHSELRTCLASHGLTSPRALSDLEARAEESARQAKEHAGRALRLEQTRIELSERIERLEAARVDLAERMATRIRELEATQRRLQAEVDIANEERRRLKAALAAAREESGPSRRRPQRQRRRVGSAIYVTGAAGAVAAGVVLIASGADSTPSLAAHVRPVPAVSPRGEIPAGAHAKVASEFAMTPLGSSSVTGSGALLKTGRHLTLVIQLAAPTNRRGSSFAVWLTGNGPPKLLGFVPPTRAAGTFSGDAPLPAYASRYRAVLITRESSQSPRRPGTRVLRGALSLPIPAA